ncbi:hypothetical protein TIFTF001_018603 [Ficus carica]|uniref:Uncharacterized protein n=1 Tax=Ficus carica TaxID=3494 RepID=A0AA88ANK1_FICCA|nr:hypothetical protein TIFTF001_018603 [Ficus carica]
MGNNSQMENQSMNLKWRISPRRLIKGILRRPWRVGSHGGDGGRDDRKFSFLAARRTLEYRRRLGRRGLRGDQVGRRGAREGHMETSEQPRTTTGIAKKTMRWQQQGVSALGRERRWEDRSWGRQWRRQGVSAPRREMR